MTMAGYTKLFSKILDSSIWNEDDKVRILWITMLAKSDQHGMVLTAPTSLALLARINKDDFDRAINVLESPDEETSTDDYDGRRVGKIEGGWLILNYQKYREKLLDGKEREQTRERVRRYRERKANNEECNGESVTLRNSASVYASEFDTLWAEYPNKKGKATARAKFIKARKDTELQVIVLGLVRYKAYVKSQRNGGFKDLKWQDGSRWFNGGWEDEYEVDSSKQTRPDGSPLLVV